MKSKCLLLSFVLAFVLALPAVAADPLRVFIRGGKKSHGPNAHEHERFLGEYTKLLTSRGITVSGALEFPTAAQLEKTDVLLMYAQDGGNITPEQRPVLETFLKRGGGLVVVHTASVANKPETSPYWKSITGGSWVQGQTKWLEGPMSLYYVDRTHPITTGVANFDLNDEIYYDMDISTNVQVLAAAYTPKTPNTDRAKKAGTPTAGHISVYDIQPQMWSYENQLPGGAPYRAFVSIPGHLWSTFEMPHYRSLLLRGIAWAAKRTNVDEFNTPDDLATLRYPVGGPSRPEKSLQQMEIHPDFKMSLVATEPLINKVMNMDWDAKGRLWVAETPEYPDGRYSNPPSDFVQRWVGGKLNPETGRYDRPAYDRISYLVDTNGDGVMDKKIVFFEGLELVTSFVFYKDGVIASAAPDIWWIRDTDGDGKADKVQKLYTGLGTRDTHAVINNLRRGFDGWIYATHGYSSGTVTSPDGSKSFGTIGSGVVRFKPDGSAFEQYSSKGGNTWGLQITWDNEVFYTQPTSGDLLMNVVLPEERLAKGKVGATTSYKVVRKSPKSYPPIPYDQLPYVQIDWVGSFTAAAGCVIYDGGTWPAAWNYSYFTTEPTINLIHHEVVTPEGVSYTADKVPDRAEKEFIAGRDMWFRPIEVRTGPDGAMYVVDFYNQAVIHNDTRGPKHGPRNAAVRPDRDHYYGRIWQVNHKSAKPAAVPDLSAASTEALVKALGNPNQQIRMTAQRLLVDGNKLDGVPSLVALLKNHAAESHARVQAVWILQGLGKLDESELVLACASEDLALRKNAIQIAQLPPTSIRGPETTLHKALMDRLLDSNARVRLEAIRALGSFEVTPETAAMLARVFPTLKDPWLESALIGTAANAPIAVVGAAMTVPDVEAVVPLVSQLTRKVAAEQDSLTAVELLTAITARRNASPRLQQVALTVLAQELKPMVIPAWDDSVQRALRSLLAVEDPTVPAATLTLVARWDTGRTLTAEVDSLTKKLIARLQAASTPEGQRGDLAISLLAIRRLNPQILPAITGLLGGDQPPALQQRVLEAFGDLTDKQAGVELIAAFPKLKDSLQTIAFNQLLRRSSWSLALVDALQQKKVDTTLLGPANMYRLRTHPDADVAKKANTVLDDLRGPEAKEKEALIAKLTPAVSQPGNVAKGKELFTANCAVCHMFGDAGRDVGPALTGMGAHGPAELLVHILDPNRAMEFSYTAIDFEMADGESQSGVVVRENRDTVLIRNAGGEKELKKSEIKKRRNTGRSLMPEGFESLGAEGLRDMLAYVCAENSRFRFIELAGALTADTRKGIYNKVDSVEESLPFIKFGIVNVHGVPFNIVDPARNPGGVNVMVLKGGAGYAKNSLPQRVEAKVGFAAKQLHFLGNVAGWGFPLNGGNLPVFKVIVQYVGGKTEELVFKNGDEFADYIREVDVPASKLAPGLVGKGRQLRFASRKLTGEGVIEKLVFESFDNGVAPTTVAVTADSSDVALPGATAAKAAPAPAPTAVVIPSVGPMKWEKGTKVLMVGGGSSHDFTRFFNFADLATLKAAGFSANYTENPEDTVRELKNVDVVLLSVNRKEWATPEVRKALFDFAAAGKGLVLLHAGIWYNFPDWPEYNLKIVGGGSRGHDKLGEFGVKVVKDHPITAGVSKEFRITDELYYMTPDPAGSAIDVLVETTNSIKFGKPHPSVYVVQHPKARIAAIALGHDARAHDLPEFKKLLINSINWSAGKAARTE